MKAQCCICADLFESSSSVAISAAPCGHVFHEACLIRWLDTSSTCPSCRSQVHKRQSITRLFFDVSEEVDGAEDVSRVKNQLSELKAQVNEKSRKLREAEESEEAHKVRLAVSESNCEEVSSQLKQEKRLTDMLKLENKRLVKENDAQTELIETLRKKENKLQQLERLHLLIKGSSSEVEDMLHQFHNGGESAIQHLCSLLAVLQREYNLVLADKRCLKDQLSKQRGETSKYKFGSVKLQQQLTSLRSQLETTSTLLTEKEKENDENRRKIVHLRQALRYNKTHGSESFLAALTGDSPNVAFSPVVCPNKTPVVPRQPSHIAETDREKERVSSKTPVVPRQPSHIAETDRENERVSPMSPPPTKKVCLSPDLFDSTPLRETSHNENHRHSGDRTEPVGQEASRNQTESPEAEDVEPLVPPAILRNILHSKRVTQGGSVITRGYDGFGGSTTFVHSQGLPKGSFLRHAKQRKKTGSKKTPGQQLIQHCMKAVSGDKASLPKVLNSIPSSVGGFTSSSSDVRPSSSSSSSSSLPSKVFTSSFSSSNQSKKDFKSLSSKKLSTKVGMFVSKGPSLATKSATGKQGDFIDLT